MNDIIDPVNDWIVRALEIRRATVGTVLSGFRDASLSQRARLRIAEGQFAMQLDSLRSEIAELAISVAYIDIRGVGANDPTPSAMLPEIKEVKSAPTWHRRDRVQKEQRAFDPAEYFRSVVGAEIVDQRAATGVLWVIGGGALANAMLDIKRRRGYAFAFRAEGAAATEYQPAWRSYLPIGELQK